MRHSHLGLATAALAAVLLFLPRPAWCARLAVGSYYNHMVLRFQTPPGIFLDTIVPAQSGGLQSPVGVTLGPDGHLYVAGAGTNKVHRYHRETGESLGDFATGINSPADITFGPDGHLYVVNHFEHRVDRFDGETGAFLGAFTYGNVTYPKGLAFSPNGQYLLVTDPSNDRVVRFNGTTGAFVDVFIPVRAAGLDHPYDVIYGPDGKVYVTSLNTAKILCFDGSTGAYVRSFTGVGSYRVVVGMAFDPAGTLYVCDWGQNNIQRFNIVTGQYLGAIAPQGGLDHPYFLTFLPPAAPETFAAAVVVDSVSPGPGLKPRQVPGIKLTWSDSGNDEDGYVIERKNGDEEFTPVAAVGADTLTYTDRTVLPEVAYTYRVHAHNSLGDSFYSPTATATIYPEVSVVTPSSIDFPNTLVGQQSTQTVTLRNPTQRRVVGTLAFTGGPFSLPSADQSFSLGVGESKEFTVTFAPAAVGASNAALRVVVGNAPPRTIDIRTKGMAAAPAPPKPVKSVAAKISLVTPSSLKFTGIYAGEATSRVLKLRNASKVALTVAISVLDGPFSIGEEDETFTLAPGATRSVNVLVAPTAAGKLTGALQVTASLVGGETTKTYTVKLQGTAKAARATSP